MEDMSVHIWPTITCEGIFQNVPRACHVFHGFYLTCAYIIRDKHTHIFALS